jgi:sulfatase modifying factor 1
MRNITFTTRMKNNHLFFALFAAFFLFVAAGLPADKAPRRNKDFALFIAMQDDQHRSEPKYPDGEAEKVTAEPHRNIGFTTLVLRNPTQADSVVPKNMVFVPGGTFEMGDVFGEGEDWEKPVHTVTLSGFYIGKTEVTFEEYDAFCTATGRKKPSDAGWGRGKRPAINVSWHDAVAYCNWLSERQKLKQVYMISGSTVTADSSADGYRLPTEAEWEYAARSGGKQLRFGNSKDVADPSEINFAGSPAYKTSYSRSGVFREKTTPAGSFQPNDLGLHDMTGNVWEWCWDWHGDDYYGKSAQNNPSGPVSGNRRVLRGGSWGNPPDNVRVAYRNGRDPATKDYDYGFRLVRTALLD